MDYSLHYERLIERARTRQKPSGYTERHHVVPRCMGGTNEPHNIVALTPEEHFVAHQLLVKMHPAHVGLMWAASAMCGGSRRQGNKLYGWLRRRFSAAISKANAGRTFSPETRAKMADAKLGKKRPPHTPETKAKMSAARVGIKYSPETIARFSAAKRGVKYGPMTEESKRKKSVAMKARAKTLDYSHMRNPEYRRRQSEIMRQIWAERKAHGRLAKV